MVTILGYSDTIFSSKCPLGARFGMGVPDGSHKESQGWVVVWSQRTRSKSEKGTLVRTWDS